MSMKPLGDSSQKHVELGNIMTTVQQNNEVHDERTDRLGSTTHLGSGTPPKYTLTERAK